MAAFPGHPPAVTQAAMATSAPQRSGHAEPHTAEPHTAEPPEGNYFVSTYPPFSCWESGQVSEVARVLEKNAEDGDAALGLYVHVPFCLRRCDYCYYRSYSAPSREQTDGYVEALLAEWATTNNWCESSSCN